MSNFEILSHDVLLPSIFKVEIDGTKEVEILAYIDHKNKKVTPADYFSIAGSIDVDEFSKAAYAYIESQNKPLQAMPIPPDILDKFKQKPKL